MSTKQESPFTLIAVVASGLLMVSSVIAVNLHQNRKMEQPPQAVATGELLQSRQLRFVDQGDGISVYGGHVRVFDEASGAEFPQLREDEGFIRTVLNGLAFERSKRGITASPVFELASWSDGKLILTDLATGAHVGLGQFGAPNKAVFMRFLTPAASSAGARS